MPTWQNYGFLIRDGDLMAEEHSVVVVTLCCPLELPLRDMCLDKRMDRMAGCKPVLTPFAMGMGPNWRSVLVNKQEQKLSQQS